MEYLIRMERIVKSYYIGTPNELQILRGIDMEIRAGEFISIVGESGSGKSTMMNIIGLLFYDAALPVPEDVRMEQDKIDWADVIAFIYPDFWTASPAMLEGWFQRVLTYGYAYGPSPSMHILQKAMFLITMGGSLQEEIRRIQVEAMKTIMEGDRLHNRVRKCEFHIFDQMTRGYGNDEIRQENTGRYVEMAYELGRNCGIECS